MTLKAWQGPSEVTGDTIVLGISCLKQKSKNRKTGPMAQVSAFVKDTSPLESQQSGKDEAVCGSCPLRPKNHKAAKAVGNNVSPYACYVKTLWKTTQWTAIVNATEDHAGAVESLRGKNVRFGEYGNMSSIPREIIEPMIQATKSHTLYDHEWRKPENQWMKAYAMASVHSEEERQEAKALGWRTFRTGDSPEDGEIYCPHFTHGVQCVDCKLCSGNCVGAKDIVNPPHA